MRRDRHNAFTLVELLVVIAIIVTLLAILMPSMSQALRAANLAVCGSNLKQINTVTLAYAADHRGVLVPFNTLSSPPFTEPWEGYVLYRNGVNSGGKLAPFGMALTWERGYTDTWEIFFCPDQRAAWHDPESWPEPFGSSTGSQNNIRAAYDYNPYPSGGGREFATVASFPVRLPLGLDVMSFDLPNASDALAHDWAPGWSVMMFDGSVSFRKSEDAKRFKFAYPFGPSDVGHSATRYKEALDILLRS